MLHRLVLNAAILAGFSPLLSSATCDRACLLNQASDFNANMMAHTPEKVPLAPHVSIRENTKAITLAESRWTTVRRVLSVGAFADPIKGNAIEHVAAEMPGGKTVYIGTRLKLEEGKITEVEIDFDDGPMVNPKNLMPYDPIFNTIVPPEERSTREHLERMIRTYFGWLTDHKPDAAAFDPRCDRYHSGTRITHNARNGVEASADVGCYESAAGPRPWGPAKEIRIAAIDPERGIVIGYTVLFYGDSKQRMLVNEIFKIIDGRIRMIDNIGLMEEGITTSGFAE